MFDKTTYNPEWVPRIAPYSKHRKPPLKAWTDPDTIAPYQIPPLHRTLKYRKLVQELVEDEEK